MREVAGVGGALVPESLMTWKSYVCVREFVRVGDVFRVRETVDV